MLYVILLVLLFYCIELSLLMILDANFFYGIVDFEILEIQ